ncbi:tetranectin isoform X2 [Osmerus mordax]|uniref:tetranectin isoform X2 n=1 Tax=Osmerus mordax TaxID=8014 RepID=UPI00350F91C3
MMNNRVVRVLCLLLLAHSAFQQTSENTSSSREKNEKRDASNAAIEELKKQIEDIVLELNLLKEQQALQTDPVKKTHHAASDDCIAKGGTLSAPLSGEENDQLSDYVRRSIGPNQHVWLGVNDMVTEGDWVDQSGSALRFKNWETEITLQPDGGRGQDCAILSVSANGKWFDESCRGERASVCEFNIV